MRLPKQLPVGQEDRRILGEFYDTYKDKQWFDSAELVENHPTQMRRTLEVSVAYNPLLEAKELLTFTQKYNLALVINILRTPD
jgi:hypothetical protein